ncbi:MAG: extracellular solute-binding protein [Thermoflexales bacterium]|nr:extracellular solute-binding protein [Thermoflexales bacterium]
MSKMKMSRRGFLGVSAAGAAGILAACATPARPESAPANPTATAAQSPAAPPTGPISLKVDKYPQGWTTTVNAPRWKAPSSLEISLAVREDPNRNFPPGDDALNTPYNRLMRDATNVFPKAAFTYTGDYDAKMLAVMSGGGLPDFVFLNPQLYGRFLQADALEDITDVWNSAASDLLKEYAGRYDGRLMKSVTVNGRIMGLPSGAKFEAQDNMLLYYRADILEKLNLQPPQTIAELEEVLRATNKEFANDPAWVGLPAHRVMVSWINSFDVFFGPTGAIPSVGRTDIRIWVKDPQNPNKLIYGSVDERIKPVLEMLQRWYKDGLIDKEFFTRDESKSTDPVAAGKCAVFFAPAWGIGWPAGLTKQNVPEARWGFTLPPADANGKRGWLETAPSYGYIDGFRKGIELEKVEAVIQVMNWVLENVTRWREQNIYGFEEWDWHYNNEAQRYEVWNNRPGTYLGTAFTTSNNWGGYYLKNAGDFYAYAAELAAGDTASLNGWQQALVEIAKDPELGEKDTQPVVLQGAGKGIYPEFFGPPTSTMASRGAQLDKLEQETFTAIITGSKTLADYDRFVEDWKKNGGNQITDEVNRWYETGETV